MFYVYEIGKKTCITVEQLQFSDHINTFFYQYIEYFFNFLIMCTVLL